MTKTNRFLLVADQAEGIWLVIDTVRCVVLHPRPGDSCESPEAHVPAQAAAPPAPGPQGMALFEYETITPTKDIG